MIRAVAVALAAILLMTAPLRAAGITISVFDPLTVFAPLGPGWAFEDFEALGSSGVGALAPGASLATPVGSLTTLGGQGTGITSGGDGRNIALRRDVQGQANAAPQDGEWSLNSNDTFGVWWRIRPGFDFDRLLFVLIDAADVPGVTTEIAVRGLAPVTLSGLPDGAKRLVSIVLPEITGATELTIANFRNGAFTQNDSFAIDGAAVGSSAIFVTPLPGSAPLLVVALAGLVLVRRRRAT